MLRLEVFLVVIPLAAAACSSDSPTTPAPTAPISKTETFSATLNRNDAETHPFTVTGTGSVTAMLSRVEPDNTVPVGLSLGTWNGTACEIVLANDKTTEGNTVTAVVSGAGRLCVRVYDVGSVVEPLTYEVQVTHP